MKKILVMGLPGAGKTYFAERLKKYLETHSDFYNPNFENLHASKATVKWINADDVRKKYNDWDFSHEGRIRQSIRMRELADSLMNDFVIVDFVAPLPEMRHNFKADWVIWMDTIDKGRFEDTNKMFEAPERFDTHIKFYLSDEQIETLRKRTLEQPRHPEPAAVRDGRLREK